MKSPSILEIESNNESYVNIKKININSTERERKFRDDVCLSPKFKD